MNWDKEIAEEKYKKAINAIQELLIYCAPFYLKQDSDRANTIGRELSYFTNFIERVERFHKQAGTK